MRSRIIPNLWFDRQAEEAAHFYASLFKNSKVGQRLLASQAGFEIHGIPEGAVMTIEFEVAGLGFVGINGGPLFKFNPSISFLIACRTVKEVEALWEKLAEGGLPLMELGTYPFSERFGWTQDQFGVSWQVMAMGDRRIEHTITPTLMFVGPQAGRAATAVNFYTSVFEESKIGDILRYGPGEEPDKEGTIKHAGFSLAKQGFAAMDSAHEHKFAFNEAISLMVPCKTQKEIDYFWRKLTAEGGEESMCGWLKDRFGVSWQVAPFILSEMLHDADTRKVERVTNAFLKMKKFDIRELKRAFNG